MNLRSYTEEDLAALRAMPKRATNPQARWLDKPKAAPSHRQRSIQVQGEGDALFAIYQRESLQDRNDFSCGIRYYRVGATPLTLARYNGPSHMHGDIHYRTHIHRATVDAISAGRRPESEAVETDRYETLEGATACLLEDFHIVGIMAKHDEPRLVP